MANVGMPQPDQSKIGLPAQGQTQGQGQDGQTQDDQLIKFRQLGQEIQKLQNQFPEMTQEAIQMLKLVKQSMEKVAGNPQRNQDKQAPPTA